MLWRAPGTHLLAHLPRPGPPPPDNPGPLSGTSSHRPLGPSCRSPCASPPPQAACLSTFVSPVPARTPSLALCSSRASGTRSGRRTWLAEKWEGGESGADLGWGRPTAGCRLGPQKGKRERGKVGAQEEPTPLGRSPPWPHHSAGSLEGRVRTGAAPLCRPILAPTPSSPPQGTGWPLLSDPPRLQSLHPMASSCPSEASGQLRTHPPVGGRADCRAHGQATGASIPPGSH